ncbi:hypothetical protein AB1N83_005958 [Pleurotus pulmonarius]
MFSVSRDFFLPFIVRWENSKLDWKEKNSEVDHSANYQSPPRSTFSSRLLRTGISGRGFEIPRHVMVYFRRTVVSTFPRSRVFSINGVRVYNPRYKPMRKSRRLPP